MKYFIFLSILTAALLLTPQTASAAVDCSNLTSGDAPTPVQIVCPLLRVVNFMVLVVGAVFVIMILYGAIKLSMALGDPKGLEGARQTWTWTIVGGLIVLGFFAIFTIVVGIFGSSQFPTFNTFSDRLEDSIVGLMCEAGVTGDWTCP